MSCAGANMVHCPGYADDDRQYTTLNKKQMFQKTNPKLLWLQQAEKILQVETDSGLAGNRSSGQSFKIQ